MLATFRILLIIFLFLGTGLTGAWIFVRDSGLKKPISPVRHPFFDSISADKFVIVADPREPGSPNPSLEQIKAVAALHPKLIVWLDVLMTADGTLVAMHSLSVPTQTPAANPSLVSFAKDSEIGAGTLVVKLSDALAALPAHRLVLNVREYRPTLDEKLVSVVEAARAADRVLIQSDVDGLLRDVRALRAPWLFGTSQAQITQLLILLPFGLEAAAPLKGDIYISPYDRGGAKLVKPEIISEIHRRQRKILVGPVDDEATVRRLVNLGVDGIITTRPEVLLNHLD